MSEHETAADIVAEIRRLSNPLKDGIIAINGRQIADRLDAAHKCEVDALKQRCAEMDAEVAAKDEVIKQLNDAISEEQRRKMATTTKPLIALPCTAQELENALHAVCDHDGLWDRVVCESYSDPDCTRPCALYVVYNETETKGETKCS